MECCPVRKHNEIVPGTIHKSGEDYLEAILILHLSKGTVRSVDVADFLQYSRPSVCNAVSVLCQAGHLRMDADHSLTLTDQGRAIAERIYERHCFFTDFLTAIGVDKGIAERDACQIEHCISEESFRKLKGMLEKYADL